MKWLLKLTAKWQTRRAKLLAEESLKADLFQEYSQLNRETLPLLSNTERLSVAALTKQPEWKAFVALLDTWKHKIMQKALDGYKEEKDILSMQAQCRMIVYLKTLEKRFLKTEIEGLKGTDDPATNINI